MIVTTLIVFFVVLCTVSWSALRMAHAGLRTCATLTSGIAFCGGVIWAWAAFIWAYQALELPLFL